MPNRRPTYAYVMRAKPCLDCGTITRNGIRCASCTSVRNHQRDQQRGNSAARGYGHQHRKRRDNMLTHATGATCPRCGHPIEPGQAVDAGHSGGKHADRIEHAACNRAAGARR